MVQIKSKRELDAMRQVGKKVSAVLQHVVGLVQPGVTLLELTLEAEKKSAEVGAKPAFKGYSGFPHALCTSLNEAIVHGIPNETELKEGDILGLDFGLVDGGFFGDSAVTVPVGKIDEASRHLCEITARSLFAAIEASRPGNTLKDIARAVESVVNPEGYGIVREFVGHGIGRALHEDPQIPNYVAGASNLPLKAGMTICIEPMVNAGTPKVRVLEDKWTAVTGDGARSAHYEHSLAIHEDHTEVLTAWGEGDPYGGALQKWGILEAQ